MKISSQQQGLFWRMLNQATDNLHLDPNACVKYRKDVLREEGGVEHLGELDRTTGYDKVIARMAVDAGDYETACRFATGDVKRFRHMCLERARAIISCADPDDIHNIGSPEKYIAGIMFQGRLVYRPFDTVATFGKKLESDGAWEDIPCETLRLVLQILSSNLLKVRKGVAK